MIFIIFSHWAKIFRCSGKKFRQSCRNWSVCVHRNPSAENKFLDKSYVLFSFPEVGRKNFAFQAIISIQGCQNWIFVSIKPFSWCTMFCTDFLDFFSSLTLGENCSFLWRKNLNGVAKTEIFVSIETFLWWTFFDDIFSLLFIFGRWAKFRRLFVKIFRTGFSKLHSTCQENCGKIVFLEKNGSFFWTLIRMFLFLTEVFFGWVVKTAFYLSKVIFWRRIFPWKLNVLNRIRILSE